MQPYWIASLDHVICSIGSFELVWVQPVVPAAITSLELFCVLTMCYFSDNVSSKENIKILWLIFMFYYGDIIAIKNSYWSFSFTKINYDFRLVIFLCSNFMC